MENRRICQKKNGDSVRFAIDATMDKRKQQQAEFTAVFKQYEGSVINVCAFFAGDNREDFRDLYAFVRQQCSKTASVSYEVFFRDVGGAETRVRVVPFGEVVRRKDVVEGLKAELRDSLCYHLADEASDPLYQTLYELIDSLDNDNDREIMYLYLANKKYSEIARETGTTESAVKQRIYRIKKKLKQLNEQQQ